MKKWLLVLFVIAGVAVLLPQAVQTPRPLAAIIPAAPLLYLEAKDFAALLKDWNVSSAKKTWLGGDNYQLFSRSRLFLRLGEAQQEFSAAAGLPADMSLADAAAGNNSALALYDIGALEFLYVTRMPSARAYQTLLWQSRAKFQPRKSAGIDYYVRQDQRRLAAFAVTNDLLLIATREEAMASALALIAGQTRPAMTAQPWYQRVVASQSTAGELRMAQDFERVVRTPYFRSYWIQRNTRELAQYNAFIADIDRSPSEFRERRVLLRSEPSADLRSTEAAVGEISRFAPPTAGLYRAWAKPDATAVMALIENAIAPRVEMARMQNTAPEAADADATAGSEQDLETRIDEAPVVADPGAAAAWEPARKLLAANPVLAVLQVATSHTAADGVFVATPSAIAVLGQGPWDAAGVRAAFGSSGAIVATAGRVLVVSRSEALVKEIVARASAPQTIQGAAYAMRFLHARELPVFQRMMTLIDFPALRTWAGDAREPLFFSENMVSLGRALARLETVTLESHDDGKAVSQTVVYKLQ